MSKNNNVNPDHYKTAGRDPQGQAVLHEVQRQKLAEEKARERRQAATAGEFTPPANPAKTTEPEENK